ncbi:MAG: T9SS type A sorting domain-containing protein [Bacteroidetes bacterium]|nr:T9SS type A sorting domain-containing protein [Bacteroidota bacterium]
MAAPPLPAQQSADAGYTRINAGDLFQPLSERGFRKAPVVEAPSVVTVEVPLSSFPKLRAADNLLLTQFPMPGGTTADLQLRAFTVFSENAVVVAQTAAGEVRRPIPDLRAYRGTIHGEAGSFVWMAVEDGGMTGSILRNGVEFSFSTRLNGAPQEGNRILSVFEATDEMKAFTCTVEDDLFIEDVLRGMPARVDILEGSLDTLKAKLAVDIDYEAYQHYGGVTACENYVASLLVGVASIYERDVAVTFEISYMRTWETEDPYSAASDDAALNTFTEYWRENMGDVDRTLASMISRKPISSDRVTQGLAWVNQLCSRTHGYAFVKLSSNNSNIEGHYGVWAHELGHNFGSPHTHACVWNPPIDSCYQAEPMRGQAPCFSNSDIHLIQGGGELMSYCHMRFGNQNVHKVFRSRTAALIRGNSEKALCMNVTSFVRSLELTTPIGGEEICAGMPLMITWDAEGNNDFSIFLSSNDGATWDTVLVDNVTRNMRAWEWNIPSDFPIGSTYRIRIIDNKNPDLEDEMEASFTVKEGTVITEQVYWRNVCVGEGAWFYVRATGAGELTYQWKKNGVPIPDETGTDLQLENLQLEDNLSEITCAITGECGTIESEPAILKVFSSAVIVQDLVNDTTCIGGSARFEVVAEGSNLTYKWYFRSPGGQNRTLESDSSVLVLTDVEAEDFGAYWCVVNSSCGNATTKTRFLIVPDESVEVLTPAVWNEVLAAGATYDILWKQYCLNSVKIEYSTNGGSNWSLITGSFDANAGAYPWSVPLIDADQCFIRISDADNPATQGQSKQFRIKDMPVRTYTLPSVGFSWVAVGEPAEQPLGIENTGRAALNVSATTILGTTEVVVKNGAPFSVEPGESYDLLLEYTPAAAMRMDGKLIIMHNAAGSPDTLEIFGEGYISTAAGDVARPRHLLLDQNYPNPVSLAQGGRTSFLFELPQRSSISLVLYNALGQKVRTLYDGLREPGRYTLTAALGDLPAGMYLYRLTTGTGAVTRVLHLMR